jgi:hypothetical protein
MESPFIRALLRNITKKKVRRGAAKRLMAWLLSSLSGCHKTAKMKSDEDFIESVFIFNFNIDDIMHTSTSSKS